MKRTQRILDRFPHFFLTWDTKSIIYNLISAVGKRLDETDRELLRIMRSHWVDKAYRTDLYNIGSLFNIQRLPNEPDIEYRNRLKRSLIEYKGGGTISAIITSLRLSLGLPDIFPIEIIENPPINKQRTFTVRTGDKWEFSSESIHDVSPSIELKIESASGKIINPTIRNLDTDEKITYNGELVTGDVLKIEDNEVLLNNQSVNKNISITETPKLTREMNTWTYSEPISEEIGIFDTAIFDESKYAIGISKVKIGFKWTAHQPATFEVKIPKESIQTSEKRNIAELTIQSMKATGVKAILTEVEER
jgi:hypothetical protein